MSNVNLTSSNFCLVVCKVKKSSVKIPQYPHFWWAFKQLMNWRKLNFRFFLQLQLIFWKNETQYCLLFQEAYQVCVLVYKLQSLFMIYFHIVGLSNYQQSIKFLIICSKRPRLYVREKLMYNDQFHYELYFDFMTFPCIWIHEKLNYFSYQIKWAIIIF